MKKIVLMLIPIGLSVAVIAQSTETKTQEKKSEKQKTETKADAKAVLDGKAFKITLASKDEPVSYTQTEAEKNKANKNDPSNPKNIAQTKEPVENPELKQPMGELAYYDWSNAKGKIKFADGLIKISLNNKDIAMENCRYNVTSGTGDLATFSAGCKLNATSAMADKTTPSENEENVLKITEEEKAAAVQDKTVVTSETSRSDEDPVIDRQPPTRSTEPSVRNKDVETAKQDKEMKPATHAETMNITGFVNGNAINGTIIVYESGKVHSYSFSGSTAGKRDAETLGVK
jgi:hypothetical protein